MMLYCPNCQVFQGIPSFHKITVSKPLAVSRTVLITGTCINTGAAIAEKFASFRAVKAEHSDENAIGVIITAEGKKYYVTGDTLYSEKVFDSLPDTSFEAVFLPVNGKGNNMNFEDGAAFCHRLHVKYAVPIHIGLFDALTAEDFPCENKIVAQIYQRIKIE